uniref:ATP synthase F0 subunit 6 n=1 Tax=Trichuris muris TaxID=70415 RepID=A0A0S3M486_TRIMR|nr:ATP synthase F0 subunit 6 [Trichuris muris]BAT21246.1 ATP synthase F0 subunit 6 [Trichuris muris]
MFLLFTLLFLNYCYSAFLVNNSTLCSDMMYQHMSMSAMDWSTFYSVTSGLSLILYLLLYLYIPKKSNFNSRWFTLLKKVNGLNLSNKHQSYNIVMTTSLLIFINNFYSIMSFNWIPSTQYWFMLMITTMFLFAIWLTMIMQGGMKLFGQMVPMSWYLINFAIWMFHNLSFFIRFISLPFRMMMNLIVGCFLVEFAKSTFTMTSIVSIYELFVIAVQSIVFIILCNMYYVEMVITPEWKLHQSNYSYLPSVKLQHTMKFLFIFIMNIFKNKFYEKINI